MRSLLGAAQGVQIHVRPVIESNRDTHSAEGEALHTRLAAKEVPRILLHAAAEVLRSHLAVAEHRNLNRLCLRVRTNIGRT